jgi:Insertion element 4 transposase N-terminal/Transposase DDE domain
MWIKFRVPGLLLFRYCSAVAEEGTGTGVAGASSLPDKIALGVLTRLVTRELVEDVLTETGRKEQRKRLLPARVVVYLVLALALFYADSCEEVMRKLVQGLSWLAIWKAGWHVPTSSALSQARERLGSEPLRELFKRAAVPCAQRSTAGAWLCGRRLMSIDGVELDVADTPANEQYFGRRRGKNGTAAFPRVLVMALAECGTHAVTAAEIGTAGTGEVPLARALVSVPGNLEPGMVVLADRGLYSYKMITAVTAAGADFCVRVKGDIDLPALEWLPDGSYRSYIADPVNKTNKLASGARTLTDLPGLHVRVVDYDVPGRGGEVVTLVTSICDHQDTPAPELAAAYHQRWVRHEVAWSEWNSQKEDRLMLVT